MQFSQKKLLTSEKYLSILEDMSDEKKRYDDVKRPFVVLTKEEHKGIKTLCVQNEINLQDYLTDCALYFLNRNEIPPKGRIDCQDSKTKTKKKS